MPKRRGIKDTEANRALLRELGYKFIVSSNRKRVFIKVSDDDLAVIKKVLPDK